MLELLLCSMLTILPDYLYRRFRQGKRLGKEITIFSVWFELRWGLVTCLMLTVGLITTVFYHHPATTNVVSFFRTVPIVPETIGRVAEIDVGFSDQVDRGRGDLPARRLHPAGGAGNRPPAGRRSRRVLGHGAGRPRWPPMARSSRPRAPTTRRSTSCRPSRNSTGATRTSWRGARSRGSRTSWTAARAASTRPRPASRPWRPGSRPSCRPRRRAPKPPCSRPRSTSTRR